MSQVRIGFVCCVWLITVAVAQAQLFTGNLTMTTVNSNLAVTGNLNGPLGQTNYAQQAAGSTTTNYNGTLNVNIDLGANTIQFTNTSVATANNSGSWAPLPGGGAGNAAANYGVHIPYASNTIPIDAALRTLSFTITSSPLALSGFGPSRTFLPVQNFLTTAGILDYRASLGAGTSSMVGDAGNNTSASTGTLTDNGGGSFLLTFPIDITIVETFTVTGFGNFTATSRFQGSFLASGTLTAVPEPATFALLGTSLAAVGLIVHRRRRRIHQLAEKALSICRN